MALRPLPRPQGHVSVRSPVFPGTSRDLLEQIKQVCDEAVKRPYKLEYFINWDASRPRTNRSQRHKTFRNQLREGTLGGWLVDFQGKGFYNVSVYRVLYRIVPHNTPHRDILQNDSA